MAADEGQELARGPAFASEARAEVGTDRVWRTIIDVADDLDVEPIVVGARGPSTVRSVLIGSVSNAVHHSTLPVLVVPPPDGAPDASGAPQAPRLSGATAPA